VLASQHYRVTLQLLDAEQLRTQQLGITVVMQRIARPRRKSELFGNYAILLARTRGSRCSISHMNRVCLKLILQVFRPSIVCARR
jgi:hypothetical protein